MSNTNKKLTEEQLGLLDHLADDLAERTAQIPIAAQRIIKHSFPQVLEGIPKSAVPTYVQMGRANIHWQLFLENRKGKLVFFFSRRKKKFKFDNSFITDISFSISPAANKPPVLLPTLLGHLWAPPVFLELNPPHRLERIVVQTMNDANRDNVLWMSLGNDLLAIAFVASKGFQKSLLFYFKNRSAQFEKQVAVDAPLSWFEAMLEAIRPWANGETATLIPIDLSRSEGEIQKILSTLSDNFLTISQKMQDAYIDETHPLCPFFPYYQLTDYAVNVRMRLTSEGKIIREEPTEEDTKELLAKKENLFQLEVQLKGAYEDGRPVIQFKILPPDFLTDGPLFDAFLQELHQPKGENNLEKHLEKLAKKLDTSIQALENALTHPSPDTFIFRVQRKRKWDNQMFVLPIIENGHSRNLFFSAEFDVDISQPTVTFHNILSVKNLLKKKNGRFFIDRPGEQYFMRLLFFVNDWKNKVI